MALLVLQGLGVGEGSGAAFRDRPKLRDLRGFLRACGVRSSRAGGSVPRHTWSRRHVGEPRAPGPPGLLSLVSSLGPFATLKGNFSRAVGQKLTALS